MMSCWLSPTSTTSPPIGDCGGRNYVGSGSPPNAYAFHNNNNNFQFSPPRQHHMHPYQQLIFDQQNFGQPQQVNHHHHLAEHYHRPMYCQLPLQIQNQNRIPNNYNGSNVIMDSAISSSSRHQRNVAEKMRRDKINGYISELAALNPMVSTARRTDKTSILRLAVSFLRLHNTLIPGTQRNVVKMPSVLGNVDLSKFALDELEGIVMCVTSAGKIIFVSHTIHQVLGYDQNDLLGNPLQNFTCIEDWKELERHLKLYDNERVYYSSSTGGGGDDTSSSESSSSFARSPSPAASVTAPSASSNSNNSLSSEGAVRMFRRSFYLRLKPKSSRNSENPYELVHVVGNLRVGNFRGTERRNSTSSSSSSSRKHKSSEEITDNDVILVAIVKQCKKMAITELSLLEANRDEYITRHLVDGKIIYTDHRIAVVAGYLAKEVTGVYGFNYMHKEDVRWTMIALRQMYYRGESYGTSCYRLKCKNGNFIYLRTHGYLELRDDNESVQSIVCINTLVSEKEGEELIRKMKGLFSPLIKQNDEPGIAGIVDNHIHLPEAQEAVDSGYSSGELEDPGEIQVAVKHLILDLPHGQKPMSSPGPAPDDQQYIKLAYMSKRLPPLSKQSLEIGVSSPPVLGHKEEKKPAPEPPLSRHVSVIRSIKSRYSESDHEPSLDAKRVKTNEAVVTMDIENRSSQRVCVVVPNQASGKRRLATEKSQQLKPRSPSQICIQDPSPSQPPVLLASPTFIPNPLSDDQSCAVSTDDPSLLPIVSSLFSDPECQGFKELSGVEFFPFSNSFDTPPTAAPAEFTPSLNHVPADPSEDLAHENEHYLQLISKNIVTQDQLESTLQDQSNQISAIQKNLQLFRDTPNQVLYLDKLKAHEQELSCCYKEHKEQRQELRTLQNDTLSFQQNVGGDVGSNHM